MNNPQVLIVDDDIQMQEMLTDIISNEIGLTVKAAKNGKAALKIIQEQPIEVLITDILMPGMDGIELIQKAKKIIPGLKILLISGGGTASSNNSNYDYLKSVGTLTNEKHQLKKPFSVTEFKLAFRQLSNV